MAPEATPGADPASRFNREGSGWVADPEDGHNVVFHEFAHQLDSESSALEGAPDLGSRVNYRDWARVLGAEYERLSAELHRGHHSLIDGYAATNPPEFFAVVTEVFFERPLALQRQRSELYAELASFYRQYPATVAAAHRARKEHHSPRDGQKD